MDVYVCVYIPVTVGVQRVGGDQLDASMRVCMFVMCGQQARLVI